MRPQRLIRSACLVAGSLLLSVAAAPALAQSSASQQASAETSSPTQELLNRRFVVDIGGFVVVSKVNGGLRGNANTADQNVDFSKDFGLDADQTRWRATVLWRINPRHHIRFSYWDNNVQHTRNIDRDLAWGDYTFTAGGPVTAQTKFSVYELDYEYAFLRRPDYEIVASAGIHYDDLQFKLSGTATLTANTPSGPVEQTASFATKTSSVPAPLPVLGIRADWAVTPHLYIDASGQVFAVSYQGIDGNWSDLRIGATWMFSRSFGVGLGYDRFATHVDLSKRGFTGRLNLGYQGGLIYFKGGF